MDGHGHQQYGEDTTRSIRIVGARHESEGVYTVTIEFPDGSQTSIRVRLEGDVIHTPFGSYHLHDILTATTKTVPETTRREAVGWLVDFGEGVARARLPVKIVEVYKKPGESVEAGETVVVVETMKMLNEIPSPCTGTLLDVAMEGSGVSQGGILFRINCLEQR